MEIRAFGQLPPPRPKNWLVEAILVTLLCCLPFGIVGIYYAWKVNDLYDADDFSAAEQASNEAGKWTRLAFKMGGVIYALFAVIHYLGIDSAMMALR